MRMTLKIPKKFLILYFKNNIYIRFVASNEVIGK